MKWWVMKWWVRNVSGGDVVDFDVFVELVEMR